jgi:regulator of protease activity HflC (stomatin/prohibitin superfamily)
MNKVFLGLFVFFIIMYSSIFVVKDNEVAVVTNQYNKDMQLYTSGLHFTIPILQEINYIKTASRTDLITTTLNSLDTKSKYNASFMINWYINNPIKYYKNGIRDNNTTKIFLNWLKIIVKLI